MSCRWLSKLSLVALSVLFCSVALGQDLTKWTNPDGKEIVGEFVRMEGKTVVLRLATGKETKVPLSALSLESHLQALKLAKPDNFNKELVKAPEIVEPAKLPFKFTASNVLSSPFEDDPSIDSFMQTFSKEFNRGNMFVVWHMMPPKMQNDVAALISRSLTAAGPTAPAQLNKVFTKLSSIVSKKRDWLLDSEVIGVEIPAGEVEKLKNGWPSIVAFFTDMSDKSIWEPSSFRQENIPNFLASVLVNFQYFKAIEPPDSPQLTFNIVSQSADRAEVELSIGPQKTPALQFQKVGKIWVAPELMNQIRAGLDASAKMQPGPQVAAAFGQFTFLAMPILTKLDDAKTKDEFKKAVQSVTSMIPPMPAGMPPGAAPGIPSIPGFPGFPGLGGK